MKLAVELCLPSVQTLCTTSPFVEDFSTAKVQNLPDRLNEFQSDLMVSCGEQFSTGDQTYSSRSAFYFSGFAKCVGCSGKGQIQQVKHSAGSRFNGDGYGTVVFTCTNCGWNTSFQYDEGGDCYYYEVGGAG